MSSEPDPKPQPEPPHPSSGLRISLDWWAVIAALVLAALIVLDIIPSIPW